MAVISTRLSVPPQRHSGASVYLRIFSADSPTSGSGQDWVYRRRYGFTMPLSSPYCYMARGHGHDKQRLEAFHMNCQRRILGFRWFHFVTNASVTSQTGKEGLAIRICRRRLSTFGHVRRLPEATPAHSALRLAVDARAGGKPDIRPEWKRQR